MAWLWEHFVWPFQHLGPSWQLLKTFFFMVAALPPAVLIGGFMGSLIGARVNRHDDESWGEAVVMFLSGSYLGMLMGGFLVYFIGLTWPF